MVIRGAVSPMARERARMVPVRIPGMAIGSTWSRSTSHLVAPRASPAWRRLSGTAFSASRVAMMITGMTSRLMVSPPARMVRPLVRGER